MKIVFVNTVDSDQPSGSMKQAYRHIDVLNQIGFDASFAHQSPEFRFTWFDNKTRTTGVDEVELTGDDFMILGDTVSEIPRVKGWDRCGKVFLCQNDYRLLGGMDLSKIRENYREADAVLCPSQNVENNLRFFLPFANVMRFKYSFDRTPWEFSANKSRNVLVMPRKRGGEIGSILALTGIKWVPTGWNLLRLENLSENNIATAFKHNAVFVSLGDKEGFGMPAAEAMSCGCVVVGYPGYGGAEFMLPGISYPVRDGDFLGLSRTLMDVFALSRDEFREIGHKASTFIRATYSTKAEVESVKNVWTKITRPVIEVRTGTRDRMRKEVAAYMPVYNEGPYFETLLKWLIPRVGAIFVAESIVPWSPNAKPGGESKAIVDKVLAECPEAKDIIRYIKVGEDDKDEPLVREANQRNVILDQIQDSGFKFVWMVEADEFYRDGEAEDLWSWFFDKAESGARVANCHWHTYWRSTHWRVEPQEKFRPNVAFLSDCRFKYGRVLIDKDENNSVEVPDRTCMIRHYSWARTPADVRNKLAAWGHSKELIPDWYDNVFMKWSPESGLSNLHPTNPASYREIVRCDLPMPEAMEGHPFAGLEVIEDTGVVEKVMQEVPRVVDKPVEVARMCRIKAVIMHHNKPENADRLYNQLVPVFDDVEIFDNGSDPDKVPIHTTRARENVYWTGTWNEVMRTCNGYDAVWVLGCDIELIDPPWEYRKAIESSLPFGCWSPCIDGRAHPFMRAEYYQDKQAREVRNIEGMALAVSGLLMKKVEELVPGSKIGFGQDFWLCFRSRQEGLRNIIDGRVSVHHPVGIGYDEGEAHRQMEETFGGIYGKDFRKDIFQYDERFEGNLKGAVMSENKQFTIVTVDNGWGLSEFIRVTSRIPDVRRIVMRKGIIESQEMPGIEFVPYSEDLSGLISQADVAFFPRVGVANKDDYFKIISSGVAMVVREICSYDKIEHMKNGWMFRDEVWACHWLSYLKENPNEIERIRRESGVKLPVVEQKEPLKVPEKPCKVTVITPTYHRDLKVVRRCIDCMLLQTEKDWVQVICSDGELEVGVRDLVKEIGDTRISYHHTLEKKEGDYGNTVRSMALGLARAEYVLFFDDDNVILPNYLEKMLEAVTGSGADYAVCKIMHFGPLNEKEVGKAPKVLSGDPVKLYHIDPLQVLVRRDIMQKIGWDTEVGYLSDGVSLEKLAVYKLVRVNEVLGIHI